MLTLAVLALAFVGAGASLRGLKLVRTLRLTRLLKLARILKLMRLNIFSVSSRAI